MTRLTDDPSYNPNCKITNSSGKDIIILDGTNSPEADKNKVLELDYEQILTLLKLDGGNDTVLKAGSTGNVALNDTYIDEDGETHSTRTYNLIFADPGDLSPVKAVGESYKYGDDTADPPTPDYYPDIEVKADDAAQASKAKQFVQVITAYPSSTLAQGFTAALKSTDDQSTADDAENAVNNFFKKNTKSYTTVDLSAYTAASTYQSNFAAAWYPPATDVPFNPTHTIAKHTENSYWLYSAADMGGGSRGGQKASCLGKVMFLNGPSIKDLKDHNSGMQVYFGTDWWMLPGTTDQSLLFDKGQFVDQITDVPSFVLQAMWVLKSTFTGDVADTTIWPALIGTVGGTKVIGIPMHAEDGWDKFADNWSDTSFQGIVGYFLQVMGVLMAIDFIFQKVGNRVKKAREKKANDNKDKDLSPEQEAEVKTFAEKAGEFFKQAKQRLADRFGKEADGKPKVAVPDEPDLPSVQLKLTDEAIEVAKGPAHDAANKALDRFQEQLDALNKFGSNQKMKEAATSLEEAHSFLRDALKTGDFTKVSEALKKGQVHVGDALAELNATITTEQATAIENSENALNFLDDVTENTNQHIEDESSGEVPEE